MREGSPNRLYAIHPLNDSPAGGKSLFQNSLPASHSFSIFYRRTGVPISLNQRKQGFYEIQQKKIWGTPAAGTIPPVRARPRGRAPAWRGSPIGSRAQ